MVKHRNQRTQELLAPLHSICMNNNGAWDENIKSVLDVNTWGEKLKYHSANISAHYVLEEEPEDHEVIGYGVLQSPEFVKDNFGIECSPGDTIIMGEFLNEALNNFVIDAFVCNAEGVKVVYQVPYQGTLSTGCSPHPERTIKLWSKM